MGTLAVMALIDLVTMPVRLGVAATRVTFALAELVAPEGPVLRPGGIAERLGAAFAEDGTLERLLAEGGTLDQLVALGETLEAIAPRLTELGEVVPELHSSIDALHEAVGPIGELAGRLPGARRRALAAAPAPESDDALF